MGYADPGAVNAHMGPAEATVAQRERALQQAHAQARAAVTQKLQDMSDIEQWGQEKYGADREDMDPRRPSTNATGDQKHGREHTAPYGFESLKVQCGGAIQPREALQNL